MGAIERNLPARTGRTLAQNVQLTQAKVAGSEDEGQPQGGEAVATVPQMGGLGRHDLAPAVASSP